MNYKLMLRALRRDTGLLGLALALTAGVFVVVDLVGAGHAAAWGKVLALAAVNPVIAGLAHAGETVF